MHAATLQALEFDQIVRVVRGFTLTPLGEARLRSLRPQTDPRRVASSLSATTEAVRFLEDNGVFPLRAPVDFEATLAALAIEGRPLEPMRLVGMAGFLDSFEASKAGIRRASAACPILGALVEPTTSFKGECTAIRDRIDEGGEVLDSASPELRAVRDRLRKLRTRLRATLESFLRGRDTSKYLQDQIVTDRNGRYVLVVRAEHRNAIPGIVHGASASGASLYLEPLSTVEVNNDVVALEEQETAEVRRILLALSDALRRRALDLQRLVETATELDVIQAKARFSELVGGIEPLLTTDPIIEIRSARHPLLVAALADRLGSDERGPSEAGAADSSNPEEPGAAAGGGIDEGAVAGRARARASDPVPVDILLTAPATSLVITGPNTGGKTVALKTVGLLALMAQAGLLIPAAPGARLPIFRSVFADIGDEQSIAASLSTFSCAHREHRRHGPGALAAGARAARRDRRRHRPGRGRCARRRRAGSLPDAGRAGRGHHSLGRAQVVGRDDAGRRSGGFRLRGRDVRADLPIDLRHAGPEPGTGNGGPARDQSRRSSSGRGRTSASARRSSPSTWRRSNGTCTTSSTSGGW